jgi:hypothetical protein
VAVVLLEPRLNPPKGKKVPLSSPKADELSNKRAGPTGLLNGVEKLDTCEPTRRHVSVLRTFPKADELSIDVPALRAC